MISWLNKQRPAEMRDLQMARANVARLMGYEEKDQEKEKGKEAEQTSKDSR